MSDLDVLNNYQQIKVIGKGSYGEVWLVKHLNDRKQYVLKKMDFKNASKKERRAAEQEAKLLSKLKHPNIVAYKDSFESKGYLYIAMGFCEGGDLYARLKEQKGSPLDERQLVEWFVQIAMALQYMHERHILHRDLKTQNIFLTKSKIIKVGDLGIARVLDSASDMATTLIGTPYYMSPELFSNKPYNHKSDVWALGCCVYEMATLKHAFNARDMNSLVYKILKGKLPAMPKVYSDDLVFLIKAMLQQNASKRPSVNRILRDPYIKKNIAIFLEGTKSRRPSTSGGRPTSSGSRPSSAKVRKPVDVSDGSVDSSVSESQDSDMATLSKVELSEGTASEETGHEQDDMRDLNTIEEASASKEAGTGSKGQKKEEVATPSGDDNKPRRSRKKKPTKETDDSIFDHPVKVDKPRPLPPPPASSGTPSTPKSSRPKSHRSSEDSSVSVSVSQDGTPVLEEANRSRPNSAARAKRRQRLKQEGGDTPNGSSDKHRQHPDLFRVKSSDDIPDKKRERSREKQSPARHRIPSIADGDSDNSGAEDAPEKDKKRSDKEMNNFISLLDTTLNLNKNDDKSDEEDAVDSTDSQQQVVLQAEEIPRRKSEPAFGIGAETLGTAGRLMERINALRKDCMRGLGIEKMHRAYEILENVEGENVEGQLIDLLGKDKFDVYAGKIWQLKFCEESAFGLV